MVQQRPCNSSEYPGLHRECRLVELRSHPERSLHAHFVCLRIRLQQAWPRERLYPLFFCPKRAFRSSFYLWKEYCSSITDDCIFSSSTTTSVVPEGMSTA